ncbi:MAG: methyl-accepting chemotaxis protein [Candidatus Magnetoglobus multicellularis str. Araruama]|uniref:Methyl-accepting chemotaxis protein n=1 Tax=Candidatus Magnetoglobus multicellularis str. Araruama TaxID=890399 RepID=A0A1V1P960_9BACT|nr:MAG: methyl-accepting chemotaxis protein [Candidatus Magnetoglobus multicellularis str. Araruama]
MNIEKQTETAGKHAEHEEAAGLRTMIWITIIALVLGLFLSLYITKSITRPLIDIVNIAKDIAHGELNKEITIDQRDEIGDLANNFRNMVSRIRDCVKVTMDQSQHIKDGDLKSRCENKGFQGAWKDLTKGINDIVDAFIEPFDVVAQNLNRLSRGDIPDLLDHDYKGDFNEMRNSLNQLIKVLSTIINEIKSGTDVLLDSVQDLTVSSQEISSTSNEQAAAVKEIVSTMEDSDQLAKSVAGKISEVTDRTTSTKDVVNRGFTVIKESLDKMSEIKTANAETITDIKSLGDKVESIWEIVNMINGIADQTKIIAFNAELEASSAGEAGKNFQIVASEIRRLADSTVSSTSEIKAKITEIQQSSDSLIIASEEGTVKITEGWELSNNLKTIFDDILHSADVSATASDQIATSVNQQASAFEQILLTLKQISEGIDNFVISTKSTSEASEKLKEISNNLHTVLENYLGHGDKSNG